MKKHTLLRNSLRSGFRAKERFLSLFGIIAVSSSFFAGLTATSPDMKTSAEKYYRETGLMDLHLVSTAGFCGEELDALAVRGDIAQLYGGYSETAFLPAADGAPDEIVQIYSMPGGVKADAAPINQPVLTEGRMPQRADECLIEVNTPGIYEVGGTLTVRIADEERTLLAETEFEIVGKADWSMYVDFERGTTTVGNGSIDSFLLVQPDAFDSDVYTDIFLTLTDAAEQNSFQQGYSDAVDAASDAILEQAETLSQPRAAQIRADAAAELNDVRKELDDGWQQYEDGLSELNTALRTARIELQAAKRDLESGRTALDAEWESYGAAAEEYNTNLAELTAQQEVIDAQTEQLESAIAMLETQIQSVDTAAAAVLSAQDAAYALPYPEEIQSLIDGMSALDAGDVSVSQMMGAYFAMPGGTNEKYDLADNIVTYLNSSRALLEAQLSGQQANVQLLTMGQAELDAGKTALETGKADLDTYYAALYAQEVVLTKGYLEYNLGTAELETRDAEEHQKLADAKTELENGETEYAEALEDIDEIAEGIEWYAFGRSDNPGWSSYGEDADRVDRIAKIFPVFFILVAALVCLTTMTRMVEEQRTEIGTCKALGYTTAAISGQFLLYAAFASVFGTAVGTVIGYQVFPRVIFICYRMMYHMPQIDCPYDWGYAAGCLAAALLCTGLTALAACRSALREVPAMLMRPKPPKQGKRIMLEKWTWFWSKCSFHAKVTIRNFFRYRSRVLMTVIGICGCTALLVTGFGLYHAIAAIVDLQYEEILVYDIFGLYDESEEHHAVLADTLAQLPEITEYQFGRMTSGTVRSDHKSYEITIMIPDEPAQLDRFIVMRDRKTHEVYTLRDDGIIINEKLAKLLDVSVGDSVTLADAAKPVQITAIMENYAMNRICMTPACCAELFGSYTPNCVYINEQDGTDENALSGSLLASDALLGLECTSQSGNHFRELVKALGYVVVLVIVFSGLLAFAVLYNLANVNILERMRELATIKVLGFYDKEVYAYIFRENVLSAFFGMLTGLFAGIFLCRYVVQTAEVDVVMFAPDIPWYCFVLAGIVTMCFTFLVNFLLRGKLRAIDMAGSMKAIE